jgi:membrane-associated protease RseP (regulator of RpoE activity)
MSAERRYFDDGFVLRPTWRAYAFHLLLLAVTFCTATIAGTLFPFGPVDTLPGAETDPQTAAQWLEFLISLPSRYVGLLGGSIAGILTQPGHLAYGLSFSLSLLFILLCHEMGHYIACRIYRVDATLPYFIPTPPMIGPAGTFGAFIKIMSPMPSRKAVFDIGVAGPIAGFLALLPVAVIGLLTMQTVTPDQAARLSGGIAFADPLLVQILAAAMGVNITFGIGNAFYFAAWVGLLVTALNLIPSGQLDGGHALYAVFGARVHRWTGRIAFVLMAALSLLGWFIYNSPSGLLVTILLGIMMRVRHPQPYDDSPLDRKRRAIAAMVLVIFLLSFVPFPIRIAY